MVDHSSMKLGKQSPRHDPRTLQFATYVQPEPPCRLPPPSVDYSTAVTGPWGMMHNDTIGDCTCAAAGHLIMEWTANVGYRGHPRRSRHPVRLLGHHGLRPHDRGQRQRRGRDRCLELLAQDGHRRAPDPGLHRTRAGQPPARQGRRRPVRRLLHRRGAAPVSAQNQKVWSVPPGGATGNGQARLVGRPRRARRGLRQPRADRHHLGRAQAHDWRSGRPTATRPTPC